MERESPGKLTPKLVIWQKPSRFEPTAWWLRCEAPFLLGENERLSHSGLEASLDSHWQSRPLTYYMDL